MGLRKSKLLKTLTAGVKQGDIRAKEMKTLQRAVERYIRELGKRVRQTRNVLTHIRRQYRHNFQDVKRGKKLVDEMTDLEARIEKALKGRSGDDLRELEKSLRRREVEAALLMGDIERRLKRLQLIQKMIAKLRQDVARMGKGDRMGK